MGKGGENGRRQGPGNREVFTSFVRVSTPKPSVQPRVGALWLNGGARDRKQKKCRDRDSHPATKLPCHSSPPNHLFYRLPTKVPISYPAYRPEGEMAALFGPLHFVTRFKWVRTAVGTSSLSLCQMHQPSVNRSRKKGRLNPLDVPNPKVGVGIASPPTTASTLWGSCQAFWAT